MNKPQWTLTVDGKIFASIQDGRIQSFVFTADDLERGLGFLQGTPIFDAESHYGPRQYQLREGEVKWRKAGCEVDASWGKTATLPLNTFTVSELLAIAQCLGAKL